MNNKQENRKCSRPNCKGKIIEKEVYHDTSPVDAFNQTYFSIKVCDNMNCEVGKNKLEEYDYGKKLSDELGTPDLKYGSLRYSRSDGCFGVVVRDIQEDGVEGGTPKHVGKEPINPDAIGEAFSTRTDYKFRELITKSLKLIAAEIKKTRRRERNEPKED